MSTKKRRSSQTIKKCLKLIQELANERGKIRVFRQIKKEELVLFPLVGADYGARTRHLNLGKVALYQMS